MKTTSFSSSLCLFFSTRVLTGRSAIHAALALLFLVAVAADAAADPRLVRVIWDVGANKVYYRAFDRTAKEYSHFAMPPDEATATAELFIHVPNPGIDFLEKGDRVRLYVVNYNRVSHVWHESSSLEQIAVEPSLVGPLLNALLLAITGAGGFPAAELKPAWTINTLGASPGTTNCDALLAAVDAELRDFTASANKVHDAAAAVLKAARDKDLKGRSGKLTDVPTSALMWTTFDAGAAWTLVERDSRVLGFDFAAELKEVGESQKILATAVETANQALLDVDRAMVNVEIDPAKCKDAIDGRVLRRANVVSFLKEVAGTDSPVRGVVAQYESGVKLWKEIQAKLRGSTWADGAIELVLKEPIGSDGVIRVDAVFASPVKTFEQRIQRSIVLGIRTHIPTLVVSSGLSWNRFDFRKLQLASATDGEGDSVSVRNRLEIVDAGEWEKLAPVWLQHVGGLRVWKGGLYCTLGTTPDRNIFRNIIYGGSLHVPAWRTVVTVGGISARGHEEKDLDAVRQQFSGPNGFALDNVSVDKLPLGSRRWVHSPFVSVTFALVSF